MTGKSLSVAVERYIAKKCERGDFPSAQKLRHRLNCWMRYGGADRVREFCSGDTLNRWRDSAVKGGLRPATVEATIGDLATIVRSLGITPDLGDPLLIDLRPIEIPSVESIGRLFGRAGETRWPVCRDTCKRQQGGGRGVRRPYLIGEFWRALIATFAWTALRLSDVSRLQWRHLRDDRIEIVAQKTARSRRTTPTTIPAPGWLLDLIRPLKANSADPTARVFGLSRSQGRLVRRSLREIATAAGVVPVMPQQFRQFAVSRWAIASGEAGRLIHGCDLGVLRSYYDRFAILSAAAPLVEMPEQFDPPARQSEQVAVLTAQERRIVSGFRQADKIGKQMVLRIVSAGCDIKTNTNSAPVIQCDKPETAPY